MGHNTTKNHYDELTKRLNKFPQGAPPSESLYAILKMLFNEEEALLVSKLPIKPFTADKAAGIWKLSEKVAKDILDNLASRALLTDLEIDGNTTYSMPPPMAGFFEFSLMRVGGHLDQKVLSELFHQYVSVEDEFITSLMTLPTPVGRAFVHEETIDDRGMYVLDYERATEVIKTASHIGVGTCYCRHKKHHVDEACDAPMEICMTFNNVAKSLTKSGHAKTISVDECLDLLEVAKEHNLVQFGENVQNEVAFICNCCSCCCEALQGARKVGAAQAISSSNYVATLNQDICTGCGRCVNVCPVDCFTLVSRHDISRKKKMAVLDQTNCIGCGVCVGVCKPMALTMEPREERVFTPIDLSHRVVMEAIETNKLQNLIFDNQSHLNHRVLAAILGVILKLPPTKQILASKQVKSKYIGKLIKEARIKSGKGVI